MFPFNKCQVLFCLKNSTQSPSNTPFHLNLTVADYRQPYVLVWFGEKKKTWTMTTKLTIAKFLCPFLASVKDDYAVMLIDALCKCTTTEVRISA